MNLRKTERDSVKHERLALAKKIAKREAKYARKLEQQRRSERVMAERARYGNEAFNRRTRSGGITGNNFAPEGREAINPRGRYSL